MNKITINAIRTIFITEFMFKRKTFSRNITKLRVALQNMYSAELLQMAASGIAMISTISDCRLETSSKIRFMMRIKF